MNKAIAKAPRRAIPLWAMFAVAAFGVDVWIAGPPVLVGFAAEVRPDGDVVTITVVDRVPLEALFITGTELVETNVEL